MIGSCSDFGLRGLEDLLITAVDELGDLTADQVAGVGENLHAIIPVLLDRSRHVVLLQEDAPLRARRLDQVKAVVAQPLHCVFKSPLLNVSCHVAPDCYLSA